MNTAFTFLVNIELGQFTTAMFLLYYCIMYAISPQISKMHFVLLNTFT